MKLYEWFMRRTDKEYPHVLAFYPGSMNFCYQYYHHTNLTVLEKFGGFGKDYV
jgi:hypothetical protein